MRHRGDMPPTGESIYEDDVDDRDLDWTIDERYGEGVQNEDDLGEGWDIDDSPAFSGRPDDYQAAIEDNDEDLYDDTKAA